MKKQIKETNNEENEKIKENENKKNNLIKNVIICILTIMSMAFIPSLIASSLVKYNLNQMVITAISDMIFLALLIIVFFKDVVKDIKVYFKNFNKSVFGSFKWYFLGIVLMAGFNLIINNITGSISDNETLVRSMIYKFPAVSFICVALLAPFIEEIVFRKSVMNCTKNKWIGSTISALLFGLAHVISYLSDFSNIIYMLPYASLGFTFAMMDYESDTMFSSVTYHALHNAFSFVIIYGLGAL